MNRRKDPHPLRREDGDCPHTKGVTAPSRLLPVRVSRERPPNRGLFVSRRDFPSLFTAFLRQIPPVFPPETIDKQKRMA